MFVRHSCKTWLMAAIAVLGAAAFPRVGLGQPAGIDPAADKLLRAATTFLASQKQFSVDTQSTVEVVLASGQKIQFDSSAALSVERPNKLRAERRSDLVDQDFYYDGKSLTLHNPGDRRYATVAAPGTLEQMMDFARTSLDLIAPGGDLVYANAYDILTDGVKSGFVVGKSVVDGKRCDHLAFRADHVDWQIWIEEGAQPLPCKMVITSSDVAGAPQFTVRMTKWNLAPRLSDKTFEYVPPADAEKIDFLSPATTGPQPR
jgi:hypothetical protein